MRFYILWTASLLKCCVWNEVSCRYVCTYVMAKKIHTLSSPYLQIPQRIQVNPSSALSVADTVLWDIFRGIKAKVDPGFQIAGGGGAHTWSGESGPGSATFARQILSRGPFTCILGGNDISRRRHWPFRRRRGPTGEGASAPEQPCSRSLAMTQS